MPPRLSLKLLGGFRAEVGSRQVSLPRKARALLAYLALSPPGPHSRPKPAGLLWGNTTEEQARNSLRQAGCCFIRRALLAHGLEPIAQDADTVMVDLFSLDIDVLAFARPGPPRTPTTRSGRRRRSMAALFSMEQASPSRPSRLGSRPNGHGSRDRVDRATAHPQPPARVGRTGGGDGGRVTTSRPRSAARAPAHGP